MAARCVLMVRPVDFGFNEQTSIDNEFQKSLDLTNEEIRERVLAEFDGAVETLRKHGIEVLVLEKAANAPHTPDAIFPNNWFATDEKGDLFVFPMKTPNRRAEVRVEDVARLLQQHHFVVGTCHRIDRLFDSQGDQALEGTGSIVFDHRHKLAYAALSERCHYNTLAKFCHYVGYHPMSFSSHSSTGKPIYHTNVLMSVGEDFVVLCSDAVDDKDQQSLANTLLHSGKTVVRIQPAQMEQHFCGNILELWDHNNERVLVMSTRAWQGFSAGQQRFFQDRMTICAIDIETIETIGGGSIRCMMAEVFNPKLAVKTSG